MSEAREREVRYKQGNHQGDRRGRIMMISTPSIVPLRDQKRMRYKIRRQILEAIEEQRGVEEMRMDETGQTYKNVWVYEGEDDSDIEGYQKHKLSAPGISPG